MPEVLYYNLDMTSQSRWKIVTVHPAAKSELMYVQEAGDFYSGKNYYTMREGLDSYLLKVTLSGKGWLDYGGVQYELTAGSFFWIDCQKPQSYHTDGEIGNWHVIWVHFRGANAEGYYRMFQNINGGSPVGTLPVSADAVSLLESLLTVYMGHDSSLDNDVYASSLLTSLLSACIHAVTPREAAINVPQVVREVKSFLLEHYDEPITLDSLAKRFLISKYHLQRLFKKYIDQSPAEYLNAVRLARAKELLRTTELPVGEIAYQVGIENPSYFISMFRSREGITPQKFRHTWSNK